MTNKEKLMDTLKSRGTKETKQVDESYHKANVRLGLAIAEGMGLRNVLAKAKERYTKGSKASQAKGVAKANKEAADRTAAREKKDRGAAFSKDS